MKIFLTKQLSEKKYYPYEIAIEVRYGRDADCKVTFDVFGYKSMRARDKDFPVFLEAFKNIKAKE